MTRGVVSSARRQAAQVHARRHWDCPCGRRVWGNGGKSSHQRACEVYLAVMRDYHLERAEEFKAPRYPRDWSGQQLAKATTYQEQIDRRRERKETP